MANNFSHNSSDSLAPSSDSHTDLFFVYTMEIASFDSDNFAS
jgi:hypothetical protein